MKKYRLAALALAGAMTIGSTAMAAEVDENAAAAYRAVCDKYEAVNAIDMTMNVVMGMSFEGIEGMEDMETTTDARMKIVNADQPENMQMEMTMVLPVTMTGLEDDMEVKYIFADGWYYMDMGDQKIKMEMGTDEALATMEGAAGGVENMDAEFMSSLTMEENEEGTLFSYTANSESLGDYLNTMLGSTMESLSGSLGVDAGTLESGIEFGQIAGTVQTDAEQNMTAMTMDMDFKLTIGEMAINVVEQSDITFNAFGDEVTVEIPNPDEYVDYAEAMDAASAANAG